MAEGSKIAHIVETSRVTGNLAGDCNLHKEREERFNKMRELNKILIGS